MPQKKSSKKKYESGGFNLGKFFSGKDPQQLPAYKAAAAKFKAKKAATKTVAKKVVAKNGKKMTKPTPMTKTEVEKAFPSEWWEAQKRFRQPSDPADKGPNHMQRIVIIAVKDRTHSLSDARKAGHLYYWKDGKKMAAVTGGDLKKAGYTRLRDYMNRQLKKKRRVAPKHTKEEHEKKKGGWQ